MTHPWTRKVSATAVVLGVGGLILVSVEGSGSAKPVTGEAAEVVPLGSYVDCQDTCRDCQKACESKPAGSERSNCWRGCTASASSCCAANGKKPPSGLTCTCQ